MNTTEDGFQTLTFGQRKMANAHLALSPSNAEVTRKIPNFYKVNSCIRVVITSHTGQVYSNSGKSSYPLFMCLRDCLIKERMSKFQREKHELETIVSQVQKVRYSVLNQNFVAMGCDPR